jgi:hypothetical protein
MVVLFITAAVAVAFSFVIAHFSLFVQLLEVVRFSKT